MTAEFLAVHIHGLTQLKKKKNQKRQQLADHKTTELKEQKHMSCKTIQCHTQAQCVKKAHSNTEEIFFPHSVRENLNTHTIILKVSHQNHFKPV